MTEETSTVLRDLKRALREEIEVLRSLVGDEDSCCLARRLRVERIGGLEHAVSLVEVAEVWDWA